MINPRACEYCEEYIREGELKIIPDDLPDDIPIWKATDGSAYSYHSWCFEEVMSDLRHEITIDNRGG